MPSTRDPRETARKLRAKAADDATTAAERTALLAAAEELESRPRTPGKTEAVGRFGVVVDSADADAFVSSWLDLDDIIENGYRGNETRDDW